MWPEAAASNESAWEASDAWAKRKNLSPGVRDYHSLHWLLYCYLQQGRYSKAQELLALMKKVMSETTYDNKLRPGYFENNYANMAAAFVVETERWELAAKLLPAPNTDASVQGDPASLTSHGGHGSMQATATPALSPTYGSATVRASNSSQTLPLFIRGLASAAGGSAEVESSLAALKAIFHGPVSETETLDIRELEIIALAASMKQDHAKAIELMKKATLLEEALGSPSGPPNLIKPAHELFGEILLRAGKPTEAAAQFRIALLRQPNRARSLLGAARAAAQSGDRDGAAAAAAKLVEQWRQADNSLPELSEAQDYLKSAQPQRKTLP
jgi:tetratricopeptide (TPR) repeat protein